MPDLPYCQGRHNLYRIIETRVRENYVQIRTEVFCSEIMDYVNIIILPLPYLVCSSLVHTAFFLNGLQLAVNI